MEETIILETNRFLLKGISPTHIHSVYQSMTKPEIMEFFGFTDDTSYVYFQNMHTQGMETYTTSLFFFLIFEKENRIPIGECGFHSWNRKHRRADIFYSLRKDEYKRKGVISEVLPFVIEYGFKNLKLHRIAAYISESNVPSLKLITKNGFIKEGTMREDYVENGVNTNSECYSLLQPEWNEKRPIKS